ncbi:sorbitol dehydrogenase-2-like [Yasminevirus sp. GU-2018]|uniref:Sorbitol dehydrogenase-2-like n=1 Tax=Yasminevirus sp. GU-2018 TaxID=2420051 RepID=A0A5K0UCD5_9VIRU|nr:sorbitol dehydrogenase-2-like [Yasminevirus sp. GU-2018]
MDDLISRLEHIREECRPPEEKKRLVEEERKLSDFDKLRLETNGLVREARKEIDERNQLLKAKTGNTVGTVRMGSDIRMKLRTVDENIKKMEEMAETKSEKKKKLSNEEIQRRKEIIELAKLHVADLRDHERLIKTTPFVEHTSTAGTFGTGDTIIQLSDLKKLPELDDPQFKEMIEKDREIDQKLDDIETGVRDLKQIAVGMSGELAKQDEIISHIDTKVDTSNAKLKTLNASLKDKLNKIYGADKFCLSFILIVILLGLLAWLYDNLKDKF